MFREHNVFFEDGDGPETCFCPEGGDHYAGDEDYGYEPYDDEEDN